LTTINCKDCGKVLSKSKPGTLPSGGVSTKTGTKASTKPRKKAQAEPDEKVATIPGEILGQE